MTFEQILTILLDPIASDLSKTPFQRAADLHAKLQTAPQDSQKPAQARRGRKSKPDKVEAVSPVYESVNDSGGHVEESGEAHS